MSQLDLKIGPKIKGFRRQLGIQANKLAEKLNISPSYLTLIEGGKRKIDADLLLKICQELKIEVSDLAIKSDINLANNISMQIAATNPLSISRDEIDQSVLDREKEIFADQAKESGKPDNIIDKIVEGRVEKFFAESCLLEQQYIKDPDRKVLDLITESVATLGENIVVNRFIRFAIGESSLNGKS